MLDGQPQTGVGLDHSALPIRMLHDRVLVSTETEAGERRSTGGIGDPGNRGHRPPPGLGPGGRRGR